MKRSATSPMATPWATSRARDAIDGYLATMKTGVPISTCWNSHSASGDAHADAAVRGRVADRRGVRRAVDADVRRRDPHPARAERVPGPGRHGIGVLRPAATAADTTTGSAACSRSRSRRAASGTPTARSRRRTSGRTSPRRSRGAGSSRGGSRSPRRARPTATFGLRTSRTPSADRRAAVRRERVRIARPVREALETPPLLRLDRARLHARRARSARPRPRGRARGRGARRTSGRAPATTVDVERDDRARPREARAADGLRDVRPSRRARQARGSIVRVVVDDERRAGARTPSSRPRSPGTA